MSTSQIERKLAAVMFTDIVGFTKIMTTSEDTAINILQAQDEIFNPLLEKHSGNLLKKMGDGLLIEFSSAVNAVECALKIQSAIKDYNKTDGDEFHIRIGIHLGDVLLLGDDILGDGVNIASRIEPLASPDGICITEAVNQSIKSKLKIDAKRIPEVDLKHIDDKYTIYKLPKETSNNYENVEKSVVNNSININSIDDITNTKKEFLHTLKHLLIYGVILILFIIPFIGEIVIKGNSFSNFINYYLESRDVMFDFFGLLISFTLVSIFSYKKTCKISFKDVRNVSLLLDVLILDMNYKIYSQKGAVIKYIHKPKLEFMINSIKGTRFYPKVLTDMDVLTVEFDGNTVTVSGMKFHINKTIKKIKNRDKCN